MRMNVESKWVTSGSHLGNLTTLTQVEILCTVALVLHWEIMVVHVPAMGF